MNSAGLTALKRDLTRSGKIHWTSLAMYDSGKELRKLARKLGIRESDRARLARMPEWKKKQIRDAAAKQARKQARSNLLTRVKDAFRKVIRV